MVKAVYCWDFSDILTCQNRAPTINSMVSCIRGRGYESFLVLALSLWKLMQDHSPPSFFRTRTMALHHGDCKGWIAPPSNISWRCSRTSSKRGVEICQNLSLKGSSSSNLIMCLAASVHPISFLSREKISWYSISICLNFQAHAGVHWASSSRPPSCHNACMSSCCLSLVESFLGADSGSCSSNFFVNSGVG